MPHRPDQLSAFLTRALHANGLRVSGATQAITGDASFRHFHRVYTNAGSVVLVDAPPATENNLQYERIARRWRAAGLPLPDILASDVEQGFFLVSDLGDELLADALRTGNADARYRQALDLLMRIQALPDDSTAPPYEISRFRMELGIFREWFLDKLLGHVLSRDEAQLLDTTEGVLLDVITRQHRVCVHRDYHSRNLLVLADGTLGIVDFQDALWGHYAYDVVSLLRDCYVRWPDADVDAWRAYYVALARQQLPQGALTNFAEDFDLTGMQRHMKAIGIFARLWMRDGRPAYLADIPRVLGYLHDVASAYPPLTPFASWVAETLTPAFAAVERARAQRA